MNASLAGFIADLPSWLVALVLAGAMAAAWRIGVHYGTRLPDHTQLKLEKTFGDASIALLGLILAFTFSISLAKHDRRREMVVSDSNAIGDFYTCVSLGKEPLRGTLQKVVRDYVQLRLAIARGSVPLETGLADVETSHAQMQDLVREVLDQGTPTAVPLVNTLNEVTSSHASRLSAAHDRLPPSILLLLFVTATATMTMTGTQNGASGQRRVGATLAFIGLVAMLVWVTLDLNQPHRGMIVVSQEPMERLLAGMK